MKIIADASLLIGLAQINKLGLLAQMFKQIFVPPAVYREVVEKGRGRPGAEQVRRASFIKVRCSKDDLVVSSFSAFLGKGEGESLALAMELKADLVLMDDQKARKAAAGFNVMGVLGLLLVAKKSGLVEEIGALVQELRGKGFRLSERLIKEILQQAGEVQ